MVPGPALNQAQSREAPNLDSEDPPSLVDHLQKLLHQELTDLDSTIVMQDVGYVCQEPCLIGSRTDRSHLEEALSPWRLQSI